MEHTASISSLSRWVLSIGGEGIRGGETSPSPINTNGKLYYDKKGNVRQKIAKAVLIGELEQDNFEELKSVYNKWRQEIDYMVIAEKSHKNLLDQYYTHCRSFAVKCAKRGNDVYIQMRIKKRLNPLLRIDELLREKKIYACFITLTCATKQYKSKYDAWKDISHKWNRLINWVKRERKDDYYNYSERYVGFFRVFESTQKGFPHIHAILFFKREVWIPKTKLDEIWGAFTWIEKCRNVKGTIAYLIKYLEKSFVEESHMLTPSILWMLGLRSFGVSHKIFEFIQYLLHNSNRYQITLKNTKADVNYYIFNGIHTIEDLMREAIERQSLVRFRLGGWYVELDFMMEDQKNESAKKQTYEGEIFITLT